MSFLSAKTNTIKPNYTGLQVQTSTNTLPIPVAFGRVRLSPNVIWYNNFKRHRGKTPGKGFGGSGTTYTYTADVILALCEGPIGGVLQVWQGTTIYRGLEGLELSLYQGFSPQAPWPYLFQNYPDQALTYPGVAFLCATNYNLGSSATLPNHSFEIDAPLAGSGANGVDADPALVIENVLFHSVYGIPVPNSMVDLTTLMSSPASITTGDAAAQTYWRAAGLCISPVWSSIETAQSIFQRLQKLLNVAIFDSGGMMKFVPYADSAITANGVTYVPNMTPVFDLTDDDFQGDSSADPLQGQITDVYEAYNVERLTIKDRANAYNSAPIETRDEAAVNNYGLRIDTSLSANEICDTNVAAIAGQLYLQRQLYVRNSYSLELDARYCGLDPMDIVTLTDAALGMDKVAVRITSIAENDSGKLTVTVEELPEGVATAVAYPKQSSGGAGSSAAYATAAPVNPPIIFEPPPAMTNNAAQIWIGASGANGGVADDSWGGANVYISLDNQTYEYAGTINQPVRQGALLAPLASYSGANPQAATLSVDMTQSGGTLASAASAGAAAQGANACLVDGEVLSFTTATLTGAEQYALTQLYRALNGTTVAAHEAGAQFARLDDAFLVYDLNPEYVGQVVYVKLASFNSLGGGLQSLADCVVYQYMPTGGGQFGPVANALALGLSLDFGLTTDSVTLSDDFGTTGDTSVKVIDLGLAA